MNKIFENFTREVEATSTALLDMRTSEGQKKILTQMDTLISNVTETKIVSTASVTLTKDDGEKVIGQLDITWVNNFGLERENVSVIVLQLSVEVDGELITNEVLRNDENHHLWIIAERRAEEAFFNMKNGY